MHQIPSKVLMHFCFMCNAVVILQRNFHHIKTYVFKQNISSRLAFNEFLSEIQSGLKSVLRTNYLPDIHFPFSIFNFPFSILNKVYHNFPECDILY